MLKSEDNFVFYDLKHETTMSLDIGYVKSSRIVAILNIDWYLKTDIYLFVYTSIYLFIRSFHL